MLSRQDAALNDYLPWGNLVTEADVPEVDERQRNYRVSDRGDQRDPIGGIGRSVRGYQYSRKTRETQDESLDKRNRVEPMRRNSTARG